MTLTINRYKNSKARRATRKPIRKSQCASKKNKVGKSRLKLKKKKKLYKQKGGTELPLWIWHVDEFIVDCYMCEYDSVKHDDESGRVAYLPKKSYKCNESSEDYKSTIKEACIEQLMKSEKYKEKKKEYDIKNDSNFSDICDKCYFCIMYCETECSNCKSEKPTSVKETLADSFKKAYRHNNHEDRYEDIITGNNNFFFSDTYPIEARYGKDGLFLNYTEPLCCGEKVEKHTTSDGKIIEYNWLLLEQTIDLQIQKIYEEEFMYTEQKIKWSDYFKNKEEQIEAMVKNKTALSLYPKFKAIIKKILDNKKQIPELYLVRYLINQPTLEIVKPMKEFKNKKEYAAEVKRVYENYINDIIQSLKTDFENGLSDFMRKKGNERGRITYEEASKKRQENIRQYEQKKKIKEQKEIEKAKLNTVTVRLYATSEVDDWGIHFTKTNNGWVMKMKKIKEPSQSESEDTKYHGTPIKSDGELYPGSDVVVEMKGPSYTALGYKPKPKVLDMDTNTTKDAITNFLLDTIYYDLTNKQIRRHGFDVKRTQRRIPSSYWLLMLINQEREKKQRN